jgi:hypothetical protein
MVLAAAPARAGRPTIIWATGLLMAGRGALTPPDPQLKGARWFQTLTPLNINLNPGF